MMNELLPEGGIIRKMWSVEAGRYREHLLRLDSASRRNRFGGDVSDEFLAEYATLAASIDTVIHGFFVNGTMRGAAELRPIGAPVAREAEAAFSIEQPWQSHGVGSALLARTLLAARNRGITFLHMACLADNQRMQQLASKFDAELRFDFGSVAGEVVAPHPLSVAREIVADTHGFATALLDVDARLCDQSRRQRISGLHHVGAAAH
jgi:GNAT superfamily N-acetyltransferase